MKKAKFTLKIKTGQKLLSEVEGMLKNADQFPLDTLQRIFETEVFLESLFGHRFHINVETTEEEKGEQL